MLQLYLPIAEMSVNALVMLAMGAAVGVLAGMFGVGGGFLVTPLLMFSGIPPAVAVATGANQIVALSFTGAFAQWRRNNVDMRMGVVLLLGGAVGSTAGVLLVRWLRNQGQIDTFVSLAYVFFLGTIGLLMLAESARAMHRTRAGKPPITRTPGQHHWVHGLPFKMRFPRSKLYISAIPPLLIGMVAGILAAMMGTGGGFLLVPAMIYLLRMPTSVVIGTSQLQIIFVAAIATLLHAVFNQTVDIMLAVLLMIGGVVGVQIGVRAGQKLRGEQLRLLLALLVLAVCLRLLLQLMIKPQELYDLVPPAGIL